MRSKQLIAVAALWAFFAAHPAIAGPALLFDPEDGKILYAEEPDSQWHPASLTKIMTAYLAFEALKQGRITMDTKVACSAGATLVQPSKLGLPVGAEITVEVALQALIIKSANDVAIMLAEALGGSEAGFVNMMNVTARRLGMTRTTFVNPNGLPNAAQVTTARDLAKLGRAVLRDFPEYAHYWGMPEVTVGKTRLVSHNGLLKSFPGADGLKTGFICDSGFNVVASASRDGKRLMAVVLGEQTGDQRTLRAASLLEHGFQRLDWKQMFNTVTIDNMPIAADAKGIISMRQSVISWECGRGPAKPAVAGVKSKAKAKEAAKVKKKKGSATAAGEASTGGAAGASAGEAKHAVVPSETPKASDAMPKKTEKKSGTTQKKKSTTGKTAKTAAKPGNSAGASGAAGAATAGSGQAAPDAAAKADVTQ